MPGLLPCPSCARHIRALEQRCPFCAAATPASFGDRPLPAPPERLSRAALLAFAALTVTGCPSAGSPTGDATDRQTMVPAYGAPAPFPPAPPPVAPQDAAPQDAAPSDAGSTLAVLRPPPAPAYGGPPPGLDLSHLAVAAAYGAAPPQPPMPSTSANATVQSGATTATSPVPYSDRTLAALRPGFRACYVKGLQDDPAMAGKVVLILKIAPSGEVTAADVGSNTGVSPQVATCIQRRARNAQFEPPGPGGATLTVPLVFSTQPP